MNSLRAEPERDRLHETSARRPTGRVPGDGVRSGRLHAANDAASVRAAQRRRRKRQRRMFALAVLGCALAVSAWLLWAYIPGGSEDTAPPVDTVARRDFAASVLATGSVQSQIGAEVRVGARVSGKVERLLANIGDSVTKGQVVAQLEKADLEAVVAQRQAELELAEAKLAAVESLRPKEIEQAQVNLEESEATFLLAEKELGRTRRLHERKVSTLEDLDSAEERFSVARARVASTGKALELAETRFKEDLRQAKAEIARAQSAVENANVQLSYATITSPIDGVIASVSTEEGETVAAAMQAPTFVTVIDLERLQVDAFVDEVDIGKVKVGQRAKFTVDAFPANEFAGRVAAIYPKAIIQDNVVNYDVVIDVETPYHGLLRPEMTASVTIFQEERQDVLAIPTRAVRRERGRTLVYVLEDGRPHPREVRLGWRDGPWVEVVSGLQEGETVLLEARVTQEQP